MFPVLRNRLMFRVNTRGNHLHPGVRVLGRDENYGTYRGDDGLKECEDIICDHLQECGAGAGWPRCGCATRCNSCGPWIIVQNGTVEEYTVVQVSPAHYASLVEMAKSSKDVS